MSKIEQGREIAEIAVNPLAFLKYVKIQEPGELAVEYELWPHLVKFYGELWREKLIDLIKAKQIGICLDPATLILTSDLRWVTLDTVQIGDILIGVDEFAEGGKGKRRHMKRCEVLSKSDVESEAYLIKTTKGDIIATGGHRFLADAGKGWVTKWRSIEKAKRVDGKLRPGYKIRMITQPWGEATYEDGWFGGMLDGEGCLRKRRSGGELIVSQSPGTVLHRCSTYLNKYPHYATRKVKTATSLGGVVYNLSVGSLSSIFEIVGKCRPSRFVRETYWWEGKALPNQTWGEILSIKPLGTRRMIDLMTSTGTFIANGFVSHNSWALAIYALWQIYTRPGWNVLELSKGMVEAQELLAKSRIVYNNLPSWMRIYVIEPNSTEAFGFKSVITGEAWGSKIRAFPSTESAGIGETAGLVIHDEADFHDFYEINLSHTRATVADNPDRQLISVSTTNGEKPDSYFKNHWKAAEAGKNGFKALFYGFDARPGRGEAFYEQMVRENEATPGKVKKNYPRSAEEALSPLTAQSCFNKEILDQLWDNAVEPIEVRQNHTYIMSKPRVGVRYVAGVDVGEGVGLDYSCLNIVGKQGLNAEVCAIIYSNTIGTDSFAYDSDTLCREYFNAPICVDNIGIGRAVIDKLVELGARLYYNEQKKAGWSLTRPNKRELVAKLVESINNGSLITRWKPQIRELMEYQWVNDYPEPTGKTHGDTVIPLLFANEMLKRVGSPLKAVMYAGGRKIW